MNYDPVNPNGSYRLWCWVLLIHSSTYSSWSGWDKVLSYFSIDCSAIDLHYIMYKLDWTTLIRVSQQWSFYCPGLPLVAVWLT